MSERSRSPREAWILTGTLDGGRSSLGLDVDLGGVPLLLRLACDLAASGVTEIYVVGAEEPSAAIAAIARDPRIATRATLRHARELPTGDEHDALLVIRADRVYHRDLPKLVAKAYARAATRLAAIGGEGFDAVYATDRAIARQLAVRAAEPGGIAAVIAGAGPITEVEVPYRGFCTPARDPRELRRAERMLVGSLRKAADGIAAKAINRSISLPITRLLCRTRVMPNHVTLVALVCALAGGVVISRGGYRAGILGMLLVELGSILDGIDGELARLRFQYSSVGQWLDTVVDDVANVAYVSGVVANLHAAGTTWALPLGVSALIAFAITQGTQYALITFVYKSGDLAAIPWAFQSAEFLGQRPKGLRAWVLATAPKLLKRDFVVTLFVAFAIAGRLELILLVFAGGSFVFLAVFLVQFLRNLGSLATPSAVEASAAPAPPGAPVITGGERSCRVALVSTFPPAECGIGNYTRELVVALGASARDVDVTVLAERHPGADDTPDVRRAWHRKEDWTRQLARAIEELRPDVVHLQHEEAIFGQDGRVPSLLAQLRQRGIRTAITLHSVYDGYRGRSFHRQVATACDHIVVHQQRGMASVLTEHGVGAQRIAVIAHGTPALVLPDRDAARAQLDLPKDGPIALYFGFIHRKKRVHVAARAFEAAASKLGDAHLVIVGRMRESAVFDPLYARYLERALRPGVAAGRIIFRPGFVPAADKAAYYAAADLIVLPHNQAYGSASGVLHEAIAARRPFLCTHGKKFAEAVDAFASQIPDAFIPPDDERGWERGFEHMLGTAQPRARLASLLGEIAEQTSWPVAAQRHAALYRGGGLERREVPASSAIRHS